jgi:hypothetical protein
MKYDAHRGCHDFPCINSPFKGKLDLSQYSVYEDSKELGLSLFTRFYGSKTIFPKSPFP